MTVQYEHARLNDQKLILVFIDSRRLMRLNIISNHNDLIFNSNKSQLLNILAI